MNKGIMLGAGILGVLALLLFKSKTNASQPTSCGPCSQSMKWIK